MTRTARHNSSVAPVLAFSVWVAGFAWMVLHFGATTSIFGG